MSYATKYTVPFQSISGIDYEVLIDVDGFVGTATELIGGGNVFTTEVDTGDVLEPIRSGSATLQVFGSDYLQDLYASNPQGIRVTLMKGNEVMWLGYMTPDTFSQDFSRSEFLYDIECVEALSTLKYKKFSETTDTITFIQLIKNAAILAGYSEVYLTQSVCTTTGANIYQNAYISCGNFYDELGEGMTYYEILEEMAKYLVCSTFTAYGDALYLLDYQAIRNGVNDYYYYDLTSNPPTTVTLADVTTTQTLGYRGTGATLSRIAGKNKAVVNCSLYEVENVLPEFDDEQSVFKTMWSIESSWVESKVNKAEEKVIRFYEQPKFSFYQYVFDANHDYTITKTSAALPQNSIGSGFTRICTYDTITPPTKLQFEDTVFAQIYKTTAGWNAGDKIPESRPLVTMKSGKILLNPKVYLSVSFEIMLMGNYDQNDQFIPYQRVPEFSKTDGWQYNVPCRLYVGDYMYNGTTWVSNPERTGSTTFRIPIKFAKDEKISGRYVSVTNTNTFNEGIPELSGHIISPPTVNVFGEPEFEILNPEISLADPIIGLWVKYIQIKNIKVEWAVENTTDTAIYDEWVKDGAKNDVMYENVISDDYIEEADEVDLKICTNSDYKLALSSVLTGTGYMDKIQSLSLAKTEIAEKLILEKVVSTFDTPRFTVNPTVKNALKPYSLVTEGGLTGVSFVNCGGDTDWKMDSTTTNLIQL